MASCVEYVESSRNEERRFLRCFIVQYCVFPLLHLPHVFSEDPKQKVYLKKLTHRKMGSRATSVIWIVPSKLLFSEQKHLLSTYCILGTMFDSFRSSCRTQIASQQTWVLPPFYNEETEAQKDECQHQLFSNFSPSK